MGHQLLTSTICVSKEFCNLVVGIAQERVALQLFLQVPAVAAVVLALVLEGLEATSLQRLFQPHQLFVRDANRLPEGHPAEIAAKKLPALFVDNLRVPGLLH